MAGERSNIRRLQEAGFEITTPLPEIYERVVEGLTDQEVEVLISVRQRFERAQAEAPPDVGPYEAFIPTF